MLGSVKRKLLLVPHMSATLQLCNVLLRQMPSEHSQSLRPLPCPLASHHPEQVQRRKLERGDVPESGATALADVDAGMLLQVRGWSGWWWVWR